MEHNYRVRIGNVSKRKDGRWQAKASWQPPDGGPRKRRNVYFDSDPNKDELEDKAVEFEKHIIRTEISPDLIWPYIQTFINVDIPNMRTSKILNTDGSVTTARLDAERAIRLCKTPSDGLGAYTWRDFEKRAKVFETDLKTHPGLKKDSILSPDRQVRTWDILVNIIDENIPELIKTNPLRNTKKVTRPKRPTSGNHPVWDRTEFRETVLPLLRDDPLISDFVTVLAYSGLRFSEGRRLRWEHLQFNYTGLDHTLFEGKKKAPTGLGFIEVGKTKTLAGERQVPLSPEVDSTLVTLAIERFGHKEAKKILKGTSSHQTEYVFLNENGNRATKDQLHGRYKKILEDNKLDAQNPTRKLRRSWCTWLAENGVAPDTLKTWAGHKSYKTTDTYYVATGKKRAAATAELNFK